MIPHRTPQLRRHWNSLASAAALAAIFFSVAGPAQAEAPQPRERGVSTYTVIAKPSSVTICPGQQEKIAVRLSRQVTRTVRGTQVVGRPADVRRARISASSGDSTIATVDPPTGRAVPLQFAAGGRSTDFGAWFTVTGVRPGVTRIDFTGLGVENPRATIPAPGDDLASLERNPPTGVTQVKVECQFKVTLSAAWVVPGQDVTHDASFVLADVGLAPDANGNFQVDATVPNRVVRNASICGGSATVSPSKAHFSGNVSTAGLLHIDVTFDSVRHTAAEGCKGKGQTGEATPQPLAIDVNVSSGIRHFFFQLPHILEDDAGNLSGNTLVYLTVLQP